MNQIHNSLQILFFKCANTVIISSKDVLVARKIAQMPRKLTQKDRVKWKQRISVVISPVIAPWQSMLNYIYGYIHLICYYQV